MSNRTINRAALLKTSAKTDIVESGGKIKWGSTVGLLEVSKKDITSIQQVFYKAEVPQVVRVGTSSFVPELDTFYAYEVGDPNRKVNGVQDNLTVIGVRTPTAWNAATGATDALRREWIVGEWVTKHNAMSAKLRSTAASLTGGAGIAITDSGGYYAVRGQDSTNILGQNLVLPKTNSDGSGLAASDYSVYTAAVVSFGVGAKLAQEKNVVDKIFGNLISGSMWPQPLTIGGDPAVSGQQYDGFMISSLKKEAMPTIQDFNGYVEREDVLYVDNGLGTSTTNRAGFIEIEREFHKLMAQQYAGDSNSVIEFFDSPIVIQGPLGAAPAGTANALGWILSNYGSLNMTCIGTQTVVAPVLGPTGLILDQDLTTTEGAHYSASVQTISRKGFTVGKTAYMVCGRIVMGDWTDMCYLIGLRAKEAYAADFNSYTQLAAIGGGTADGDSAYTYGILADAATVATDTTVNYTDATSAFVMIKVDIDGTVSIYLNGTKYPVYSVGTTALVFAAGTALVPFFQGVNIGGGDPDAVISEFFGIATVDAIA